MEHGADNKGEGSISYEPLINLCGELLGLCKEWETSRLVKGGSVQRELALLERRLVHSKSPPALTHKDGQYVTIRRRRRKGRVERNGKERLIIRRRSPSLDSSDDAYKEPFKSDENKENEY